MTARKRGNLPIREHEPNFFRTSFLNSASASTNYFSPATTVRFSFSRIIAESTGAGMLVLIGLKSRQGCPPILVFRWRFIPNSQKRFT
jgi:hypothetical protein